MSTCHLCFIIFIGLELRVHFKVLLYTYKGLNEHAPPYICDVIEIYKPAKPLRSGSQYILAVLKIRTKGYDGRKCSYAEATLWNDLHSIDLKMEETFLLSRVDWKLIFQTVLLQEIIISTFSIKSFQSLHFCVFKFVFMIIDLFYV